MKIYSIKLINLKYIIIIIMYHFIENKNYNINNNSYDNFKNIKKNSFNKPVQHFNYNEDINKDNLLIKNYDKDIFERDPTDQLYDNLIFNRNYDLEKIKEIQSGLLYHK